MLHSYGFDGLVVEDLDDLTPGAGEVVVRTHRASLNPVDVETVTGENKLLLPRRLPFVPGVDVAGIVDAVGPDVTTVARGDRVVGYTGVPTPGAFATHAMLPVEALARVPDSVSLDVAAALCLAGLAGWQALEVLRLEPRSSILVHGAAGAVGSVATQLAISRGHTVLANVNSRDVDTVRGWGAEKVVAYDQDRFEDALSSVDAAIDTVGGDTFKRSLSVVRSGGALASLKAIPRPAALRNAGFHVPWLLGPIFSVMAAPKRKRGVRIEPVITRPSGAALTEVLDLIATGTLRARVESVIELDEVGRALAEMQEGTRRGKSVVSMQ